jgi:hypothetical protein
VVGLCGLMKVFRYLSRCWRSKAVSDSWPCRGSETSSDRVSAAIARAPFVGDVEAGRAISTSGRESLKISTGTITDLTGVGDGIVLVAKPTVRLVK